jgi:magnesium-transporting ATPase (P-type)
MNAVYGAQYNDIPESLKTGNTTGSVGCVAVTRQSVPERTQNLIVNILYDVNPAIRIGLEYAKVITTYAYRETATLANKGSFDTIHAAAYILVTCNFWVIHLGLGHISPARYNSNLD